MQLKRYRSLHYQIGWTFLLALLLCALIAVPVRASDHLSFLPVTNQATLLKATIYLPTATLQPLFRDRLNQQVPATVAQAIADTLNKMPPSDQGWAKQMANALLQPSATLTQLSPQPEGLSTTLNISLFPADPHPIAATLLVKFSVLNSSTIQVSAEPVAGSPTLVKGPLTTFKIPFGELTSVITTPSCADSALAVGLKFPISLKQAIIPSQTGPLTSTTSMTSLQTNQQNQPLPLKTGQMTGQQVQPASFIRLTNPLANLQTPPPTPANSYVELPASSLSSLDGSIEPMPINSSLTAQNFHITVKDKKIVITSDIMLGTSFLKVATATTYVQPSASNGNLAMHVTSTTLTVLFVTFPNDSYNKQIEHLLNSKLGSLLAGNFTVTDAAIGSNPHIPCAASDSLILTGNANLGS